MALWKFKIGTLFLFFVIVLLTSCESSLSATATPAPTITPSPTRELPVTVMLLATATATAEPNNPTPYPSPTPPPTATPITYAIQEGDTLLGIAIDHQTTTEAIEALNPAVDARMLSIGQIIILPSPSVPIATGGNGAIPMMPIAAKIENVVRYDTPLDGMWVLGEVRNEGDAPIANMQVEVTLMSAADEVVATQTAWTATAVISPNQTAPFAVLFPAYVDVHPVISIIGGESVSDLGDRYMALTAVNPTLEIVEEGVWVNGRLRNSGTLSATQISLTTTFYDANGVITGYDYRLLGDRLLSEMDVSFSFIAVPPGGNTTKFTITAQGKSESTEPE